MPAPSAAAPAPDAVPLVIAPDSPYIAAPDAVVLDATWLLHPGPERDAAREFQSGPRFPRARFWDLVAASEPHPRGFVLMLPSPARFAEFAGAHGISPTSHVIVYDTAGVWSAPRTAWMFKIYGHKNVSIVDGGLPLAVKMNVPLETGPPAPFRETSYPVPQLRPGQVAEYEEVATLAARTRTSDGPLILDARGRTSYETGHIPTSVLVDFPTTLDTDAAGNSRLRPPAELRAVLAHKVGAGVLDCVLAGDTPVINTCGGGLSAAINWLHLQTLGVDSRIYDESWNGWSKREGTPKITGPDPL